MMNLRKMLPAFAVAVAAPIGAPGVALAQSYEEDSDDYASEDEWEEDDEYDDQRAGNRALYEVMREQMDSNQRIIDANNQRLWDRARAEAAARQDQRVGGVVAPSLPAPQQPSASSPYYRPYFPAATTTPRPSADASRTPADTRNCTVTQLDNISVADCGAVK